MYFFKYGRRNTWLGKCLKSPDSEESSKSNMVNGRKHCWELNDSTFTTYINPCEGKSGSKSVSEWYTKTSEMSVNPFSADNKYPVPNRCNILQHIQVQLSQKRKIFCQFFFTFSKFRSNFQHFQKKDDN